MAEIIIPAILAAGKGNRLGMSDRPKPMVEVATGRPLMQDAVEVLLGMGFGAREIKAVTGYKGEVIKKYFGDDLEYYTQEHLNGNAGALEPLVNNPEIPDEGNLLVIQGDDADQATEDNLRNMINLHLRSGSDLTILTVGKPDDTAHRMEYIHDSTGRVMDIIPRETTDSTGEYTAGIYVFSVKFLRQAFQKLKDNTPEGKELGIFGLIKIAIESGQSVFQVHSDKPYISVNTPAGLQQLRET